MTNTQEFFDKFPVVNYNGQNLFNICVRVGIPEKVKTYTSAYMPYNIQYEKETPETIAYDYYGAVAYWWLVTLANNVYDPYFDWLLDDRALDDCISTFYGSIANAQSQIAFYQRNTTAGDPYNIIINSTSNTTQQPVSNSTFTSISEYDKLKIDNEDLRQVYIIQQQFVDTLTTDLNKILADATDTT